MAVTVTDIRISTPKDHEIGATVFTKDLIRQGLSYYGFDEMKRKDNKKLHKMWSFSRQQPSRVAGRGISVVPQLRYGRTYLSAWGTNMLIPHFIFLDFWSRAPRPDGNIHLGSLMIQIYVYFTTNLS